MKISDLVENWKNQKGFHYKNPCGNLLDKYLDADIQAKELQDDSELKGLLNYDK